MHAGLRTLVLRSAVAAVFTVLAACGGREPDSDTTDPEAAVAAPAVNSVPLVVPDSAQLAGGDGRTLGRGIGFDATVRPVVSKRTSDLPIPPPLPRADLVTTKEGFFAHARGARLHRAGAVTEGDHVSYSVRLVNRRGSPVRLQRIEGECECVEAQCFRLDGNRRLEQIFPGRDIAPGEEFEMQVHLDTTDRTGLLQLEGILDFAGAAEPVKFGILANIRAVHLVDPPEALRPMRVLLGSPQRVEARITSPIAERFKLVVDDRGLPGHLRLSVAPIEPDADGFAAGWRAIYDISADAPDAAGLETWPVVFEVIVPPGDGEDLPYSHLRTVKVGYRSLLPVEALQFGGQYGVMPGLMLDFGKLAPGATAERRVLLKVNDPQWQFDTEPTVALRGGATIGTQMLPAESISWRFEDGQRGMRELVVTMTAPTERRGPLRALLDVTLDHPRQSSLTITLTSLVR